MSFVYPDTISINRPRVVASTSVGDRGYSAIRGDASGDELVAIAGPITASVQRTPGGKGAAGVPTDLGKPSAAILIPAGAAISREAIREGDVAIDQHGRRWRVTTAYWTSLGWKLSAEELDV